MKKLWNFGMKSQGLSHNFKIFNLYFYLSIYLKCSLIPLYVIHTYLITQDPNISVLYGIYLYIICLY